MRIAFITSCMEAGRDGVGDYVRDLAAACVQRGQACTIVALNDHCLEFPKEEQQVTRSVALDVLRLPASMAWAERSHTAKAWLDRQQADWVSVQFVPYGFHPKGVVTGLGTHLAPIIGARRVHMMLHELWLGMERFASLRHRVVGWAQRHTILALVRRLAPQVIHTSNDAYRSILQREHLSARLLPLCGNIPVAEAPEHEWLATQAARLGIACQPNTPSWWFGMFGTLHPVWSPEPLFTYIAEAAERARRRVVIASIGRLGHGDKLWNDLQSTYGLRFTFVKLGERSRAEISTFLQSVDFGIATTPWQLIGKSGTAAAMLDHGLPTIVSRDDVRFRASSRTAHASADPLLRKMDATLPRWLIAGPARRPAREGLPLVAETFLADLEAVGRSQADWRPEHTAPATG